MPAQGRHLVYESDGWELDLARHELRARGVAVPLGNRAFQIFAVLVQSAGELVTKDELMARVWPGAIVEENKLQVHISAVRKALGPDRGTLRTSFGRGYRLVGNWTIRKESTPADPAALDPTRKPVQPFLTNLPAAASEVIGRTAAVRQLQEFLCAYREITLTGPGGIGKTTLALEVARNLFPAFNGDCWLVDVVSLSDPGLVPSMVAGVLGLRLGGEEISGESVARAIGGKKLLLVLDNCEHVIDAAARLAETVVRLCAATSIVATSREVLRIEGEHVYRVPPLDVPSQHQEESDIVLGHSAVQLFIARARALDSDFSPHGHNLPAIAAICRHLDGIPLAIEFAAARAAMLGPELVLSRLDERFRLLTGGRRSALPRHQTLRATLDWSYELLSEAERCLLRRGAGGFPRMPEQSRLPAFWQSTARSDKTTQRRPGDHPGLEGSHQASLHLSGNKGRGRIDNHTEQLRTGGDDEPVRGRGQGKGHDRICAYRSCGRGRSRWTVPAADRATDLWQCKKRHSADGVSPDDRD
jgi:non-specific serine/threonine protein kinase